MNRGLLLLVAILVAGAFAAGYSMRSSNLGGDEGRTSGRALAQPRSSPSPGSPGGQQRDRVERGLVVGTVESVRDRTLVVKVTQARGLKADQGSLLTIQVDADAAVLREIAMTELKKGNTVTLRGSVEDGKFAVRQVVVESR